MKWKWSSSYSKPTHNIPVVYLAGLRKILFHCTSQTYSSLKQLQVLVSVFQNVKYSFLTTVYYFKISLTQLARNLQNQIFYTIVLPTKKKSSHHFIISLHKCKEGHMTQRAITESPIFQFHSIMQLIKYGLQFSGAVQPLVSVEKRNVILMHQNISIFYLLLIKIIHNIILSFY